MPPLGETETKLTLIWAEVLKLTRVGRHDNFFDLGGHSLLAVRTATLLKRVGIDIPVVDLFRYPTAKTLAAHFELQDKQAFADGAICIRKGAAEAPLFLTHCGDGQLNYIPLFIRHIDINIPIYGLPAASAESKLLRTVEGMAARMVQMIRAVQPFGPYRIAGWPFGGKLAYEIAGQLIGADQKSSFSACLILLTYPI